MVGLEDMAGVVDTLVKAGPDAIQMAYGQADLLQSRPEKDKPALVMRIDMGNPYNDQRHRVMWSLLQNADDNSCAALLFPRGPGGSSLRAPHARSCHIPREMTTLRVSVHRRATALKTTPCISFGSRAHRPARARMHGRDAPCASRFIPLTLMRRTRTQTIG